MNSTDRASPVQLSVRELRQWLANVGEKHQDHFHKGQLPRARSQDLLRQENARQSMGRSTIESKSIVAVKETRQRDHFPDWNEQQDSRGKQNRAVVAYSNEHPAWHFRTIEQEQNRTASNETEDHRRQDESFHLDDDSPWTFDSSIRDKSRPGSRASRKSSNGEGNRRLTRPGRLSTEETITFHRESHDSTHDASTARSFSTKSTLFSDCFASQIDLEDRWVTKRDDRVVVGAKKSKLVQERQRALQEKWAQDRQVVHKKKVLWTTLKGGYKKKIVLTEENEEEI